MYPNVNFPASLGVMAFLGTAFVIVVIGGFLIYLLAVRKFARARLVLLATIAIAVIYVAAVLAFSFASSEQVLARGQEKHFCEIDCHLAYSIANVTQAKTIGNLPQPAVAGGVFTLVTVRTRFDENTIGPNRGNDQLYPNPRSLTLMDQQGRSYFPSAAGQTALESSKASGTPITNALRPGESYDTTIAFDVPAEVKKLTLLINESDWITHLIIGHENSPLHKKTRFQL
jgi:hypothetical protein